MTDRFPLSWIARHDNGWVAHADERPDGTWSAWAAKDGELQSPDYIEMDEPTAKAAAEFALREKSGHTQCSRSCSGWESNTHSSND